MKDKLSNMDMALYAGTPIYKFPKYTAMLINQINQTAQGTRPKVVGQMSELMQEFKGQTAKEWEEWYNQRKPNAIKDAPDKIYA